MLTSTMTSPDASSTSPVAPSPRRRVLASLLTYCGIVLVTLLAVDGACIALGLFPPTYDPGDSVLGWRPARATGRMALARCVDLPTGDTISYTRNEDGVRTGLSRLQILADSSRIRIGVSGDSHTDLCSANATLHSGVLESDLRARGIPATVLSYGAGRYSPLQAYLAFREVLRPYRPRVFVLNLYTGNDFYDLLRTDDRPHFVLTATGYRIAPPNWYSLDDPANRPKSRVLFVIRTLGDELGVRRMYSKVVALRQLAAEQGEGIPAVLTYMRDLWRAREPTLGYPDALTAQMLNQQLFFYHFPRGERESSNRVAALLSLIRQENPGLLLVLSPLPSYELVGADPVDASLSRALRRLPISVDSGRQQEGRMYEQLRQLAAKHDWLFVDNLAALQTYRGNARLFNDYDYHLTPAASAVIGHLQSAIIADTLSSLLQSSGVEAKCGRLPC